MKMQSTMHALVMLVLFCFSCARAFVPCMPGLARDLIIMSRTSELARVTHGLNRYVSRRGALAAEKEEAGGEEEQEPMDLDLEQMFEVRSADCREMSRMEETQADGQHLYVRLPQYSSSLRIVSGSSGFPAS